MAVVLKQSKLRGRKAGEWKGSVDGRAHIFISGMKYKALRDRPGKSRYYEDYLS